MRVIAGIYRSRTLKTLKGLSLRPTSDRLRETLFNVLGDGVAGARFLDIFAGSGAVGIEALSRGASFVTFIENHPPAAELIRKNLAALKIKSEAAVICADAIRGLDLIAARSRGAAHGYNYAYIDPPYAAHEDYSRVLRYLSSSKIVGPGAIVIVEHRKTFELEEACGALHRVRLLRQGDASLSFYRAETLNQKENDTAG
jgi:16S rRNA (guanine966-N2)-methyltransferase